MDFGDGFHLLVILIIDLMTAGGIRRWLACGPAECFYL